VTGPGGQDVTERAGEFLAHARSWAELESRLAQRDTTLRIRKSSKAPVSVIRCGGST
jgi:hypothetical protein